jgi:hypothetical protein
MEFQDNSDRNQEITDKQSELVKQETLLHLGANEKLSSDRKPITDQDLGSGQDYEQAKLGIQRSNARLSSSEDTCGLDNLLLWKCWMNRWWGRILKF